MNAKILYKELKSRYDNVDLSNASPDELCEALDAASSAFSFIVAKVPPPYQKEEKFFWSNVAAQAKYFLESKGFTVFFVVSLQDLADVLYKASLHPEHLSHVFEVHGKKLDKSQLEELLDIVLDMNQAGRDEVIKQINVEIQSRS